MKVREVEQLRTCRGQVLRLGTAAHHIISVSSVPARLDRAIQLPPLTQTICLQNLLKDTKGNWKTPDPSTQPEHWNLPLQDPST